MMQAMMASPFGSLRSSEIDKKAERSDFEAVLKRIDEHIAEDRALRAAIEEKFDRFVKVSTDTQVQVARIAGQLEGRQ